MTSKWALGTAVFVNYVLGLAVFFTPKEHEQTQIGPLPGLIVLVSIAILLSDIQLVPIRYKKEYTRTFFCIEVIMSLLFCEFFIVQVWTRIESFIFSIINFVVGRGNLLQEMGGTNFVSLLVSAMTLCFLLYSINATNSARLIVESVEAVYTFCEFYMLKLVKVFSKKKECPNVELHVLNTCEPAQVYNCKPVKSTPSMPHMRNPQCPIHGDQELSQYERPFTRSRSRKK